MRKFIAAFAAVASMFGLVLASPASAHSSHHSSVRVVGQGQSIQAAIDASQSGTTIVVKHGTYAENLVITTDGIKLLGQGATLVPPANPLPNVCSEPDPPTDGICAVGEFDFSDPNDPVLVDPLEDVTISGFTVRGFPGSGVLFFGADDPSVIGVHALGNGEYGIARFFSTGGKIVASVATDSEEAGIYVGDSPDADVLLAANEVSGNLFGFFLRDAAHGKLVANRVHDNCLGLLVLNTGQNFAGHFDVFGNVISHNNKFCEENEEEDTPPLSGIGIAIISGKANNVTGNMIINNVPSFDDPEIVGGVVVAADLGGGADPPSDNTIKANAILHNEPDIAWDGSGTGNVFAANRCESSVPDGLC